MDSAGNGPYPLLPKDNNYEVLVSCNFCAKSGKVKCFCINLPMLSCSLIQFAGKKKFSTLTFTAKKYAGKDFYLNTNGGSLTKGINDLSQHHTHNQLMKFSNLSSMDIDDYLVNVGEVAYESLNKKDYVNKNYGNGLVNLLSDKYNIAINSGVNIVKAHKPTSKYVCLANFGIQSQAAGNGNNTDNNGANGVNQTLGQGDLANNSNRNSLFGAFTEGIRGLSGRNKNNELTLEIRNFIAEQVEIANATTFGEMRNMQHNLNQLTTKLNAESSERNMQAESLKDMFKSLTDKIDNLSLANSVGNHNNVVQEAEGEQMGAPQVVGHEQPIRSILKNTQIVSGPNESFQFNSTQYPANGDHINKNNAISGFHNQNLTYISEVPNTGHIQVDPSQVPILSNANMVNNLNGNTNVTSAVHGVTMTSHPVSGAATFSIVAPQQTGLGGLPNATYTLPPARNAVARPSDMASLLFATTTVPTGANIIVNTTSVNTNANNNVRSNFSKKIILAPYEIGQPRLFREFLGEFESVVLGCGYLESAWPVLLANYLLKLAKDYYNITYHPGMTYSILKEKLISVMEEYEREYKQPTVADDIVFSNTMGAHGLLWALSNSIAPHGDTEFNRRLVIDTFWKRLPQTMYQTMYAKLEMIKLQKGFDQPDFNCYLEAALALDKGNKFLNKQRNESIAGVAPVAAPPQKLDFSYVAGADFSPVIYGATSAPPSNNNGNSNSGNNNQSTSNNSASSQGAHGGARAKSRGTHQGYNGGNNGGSLRGYYYGGNNYYSSGNRGNYRGGNYGRGHYSRGGNSNYRGQSTSYSRGNGRGQVCWHCEQSTHYIQNCPKISMPGRPPCPKCGKQHPRDQKCPLGHEQHTQSGAVPSTTTATAAATASAPAPSGTPSGPSTTNRKWKNNNKYCKKHSVGLNTVNRDTIRVINWSQFTNLDEMANFSVNQLPMEEIKLEFPIYSPPDRNNKTVKVNRATLFLKDMPKNEREILLDCDSMYRKFSRQLKNAARINYECESLNCLLPHHTHHIKFNKKDFLRHVKDIIKDEFPYCVIEYLNTNNDSCNDPIAEVGSFPESEISVFSATNSSINSSNNDRVSSDISLQASTNNGESNVDNNIIVDKSITTEIRSTLEAETKEMLDEIKRKINISPTHKDSLVPHFEFSDPCLMAQGMQDLMLISINIGDSKPLNALLDTGASMSLVNWQYKDDVGGTWSLANSAISGIGSRPGIQAYKSPPMRTVIGGITLGNFSFYSVPKINTNYDVILGRDFLNQFDITLFPSLRKVRIGHKLQSGEKSIFSIFSKEIPTENSKINEDITCIDVPCYLKRDVTLIADEVNTIRIKPDKSFISNENILKDNKLLMYLELDPDLAGMYPNMSIINSSLESQDVDILAGVNTFLPKGSKIGCVKSSMIDTMPSGESNNWQPNEQAIYTIMSDQEVAEAVNKGNKSNINCNNPTGVLDEIERFGNLPMNETPSELLLGKHARLYKPRDMVLFEQQHQTLLSNPRDDSIEDPWTLERIKSEFKLPEDVLDDDQKDRFYNLIYKYRVAFVRNSSDIHLNTIGEVDLELVDSEFRHLSVKPTRWSPETNKLIKEILNDYLESGVIKHGSGPYSSRVFIVYRRPCEEEPNLKARLVIDYRNINKALVPCAKYLAGVDSLLLKVGNHKFYSKMDLKGAYHQIGILESKKDITSIVTCDSQFVFNVLSFGLSVAPGYFEIFMERCFAGIPQQELSHYLDDCIVPADSVDEMLKRVETFLHRVVKFRMKLSPSKCVFFAREISFLGFILNQHGLKKSPEYVERIKQVPEPRTVHELMKFLGLVNFQRKFVPRCSEIIAPLNAAVDHKARNIKKKEIIWTEEMSRAFVEIKEALAEDVSLAFPQTGPDAKELKLYVDASNISIGAALFQEQEGELRPISYMSKLLSKTELRYSSYDKEILGLVKGIVAHHQYLNNVEFTVYTDCKNIVYLYRMKNCCPRLLRLLEQLSSYRFKIEHVAGMDNYISDMMSRLTQFTSPEFCRRLTEHVPRDFIPSNLLQVKVDGGAESPFETISYLVGQKTGVFHEVDNLRETLMNEIIDKPEKYKVQGDPELMRNLKAMVKPGVSTYIIVFKAAAEIFDINFYIYFGLEQPLVFRPMSNKTCNYDAYVRCSGQGVHFNPLVLKKKEFTPEIPLNEEEEEMGASSMLSVFDISMEMDSESLFNQVEYLAVMSAIYSDNPNKSEPVTNVCCSCLSSPTSAPIENELPVLKLKKHRDLYLCPQSHALGDFCISVKKVEISSGSGGVEESDASCSKMCIGVDTGSSITLVSDSTYKELYKAGFAKRMICLSGLPEPESEISVLNGVVYALGETDITFPFWFMPTGMEATHKVLVLSDSDLPACILLGGDFLRKLNIQISCQNNELVDYLPQSLTIRSARNYEFSLNTVYDDLIARKNPALVACSRPYKRRPGTYGPCSEQQELNEESYPFSIQEVAQLQHTDPEVLEIKHAVDYENIKFCPDHLKQIFHKFSFKGSILVYTHSMTDKPVPVISGNFLITIATQIHDRYNHIGRGKLLNLAQKFCWAPGMSRAISELTRSCPLCQTRKPDTGKLLPPVFQRKVLRPYDLVCIDILTLPKTSRNNIGALIVADHGSKWLQCYPIKNHSSSTLINCLKQYITSSIKCPKSLLSDNEKSLVSEEFNQFCKQYDIERIYSAPYQPHCNGFSEKNCGMVTSQLRFFAEANRDWDLLLDRVVANHNFSISSATGCTPSSYILERAHMLDADNILPSETTTMWKMGNPNFQPFCPQTKVLYKIKYVGNRAVDKLKSKFEGIFKVIKVNGRGLTYDIQSIWDSNYVKTNIHYSDLKRYYGLSRILKYNRIYVKFYNSWREEAFGEEGLDNGQVEQDEDILGSIPGIPGVVSTQVQPNLGEAGEKFVNSPMVDQDSDLDSESGVMDDLGMWFAEEQSQKDFEREYLEYEQIWEDTQKQYNCTLTNIKKLDRNLFRKNHIQKILEFDKLYRNNCIYYKPYPNGQMPNLGPLDRGIPFAVHLLDCCERNIILPNFNYDFMYQLYITETKASFREIYALAINYYAQFYLRNRDLLAYSINEVNNLSQRLPSLDGLSIGIQGGQTAPNEHQGKNTNITSSPDINNRLPRDRDSLMGRMSPLHWDDTIVSDHILIESNNIENNVKYIELKNENTELRNKVSQLSARVEDLVHCVENLTQQPNKSHNSSLNSSLLLTNVNFSSNPVSNDSNNSIDSSMDPEQAVKELEREHGRMEEYEKYKRCIIDKSMHNENQSEEPLVLKSFINFTENLDQVSTEKTQAVEGTSNLTTWTMPNLSENTISSDGTNTLDIDSESNFSFQSNHRSPLFPLKPNMDLMNMSTCSPYEAARIGVPIEDAFKLVNVTNRESIESKGNVEIDKANRRTSTVRFKVPIEHQQKHRLNVAEEEQRRLRQRCKTCGHPIGKNGMGCICFIDDPRRKREKHYRDGQFRMPLN